MNFGNAIGNLNVNYNKYSNRIVKKTIKNHYIVVKYVFKIDYDMINKVDSSSK